MAILDLESEIQKNIKDIDSYDNLLGKGLAMPFSPANSGSRKIMFSTHREHLMVLNQGEIPIIQTGFENEFGRNSSSFITAKSDYKVIYKINKFSFNKNHYYLIIQDQKTGEYDYIERVTYNHNTESYGYLYNNEYLDSLNVGSIIKEGKVIKTSNGFDSYGNKMDGVNLTTIYLSCAQNMEDSVIISESAAEKLRTNLVKGTSITINDNDILLNLYGDENNYKAFPDIGEPIKDGIFCAIRRLENYNMLYSLAQDRLRSILPSDKPKIIEGRVADIDVYCNNPQILSESKYNQQLYFYYNEKMNFCKTINELVGPLAMTGKLSYNLQELYSTCNKIISGVQFFDEKLFNNVIMEIKIVQSLPMEPGDKMSDRYGGKGVVSEIRPDNLMPVLENGTVVEVIKNQSTCINRENLGQLHEQSLTFIGSRFIDYFKLGVLSPCEMCYLWYDFVSMLDKEFADFMKDSVNFDNEYSARIFIESILEDDAIILPLKPFTTNVDIDKLSEIYDRFPWIKQYDVYVPIADSNDNIRRIKMRRPMVVGKIYTYRLKQYAEEKFSVTSLSATNLKNLNTRSRSSKVYDSKFKKTPIMFGAMEAGDLSHISMQLVVMNFMLYSSSPQGRRLFEQLLIGDPYDIDIKLDRDSKNRNAEIINTLLLTMGLKLVFRKIPKKKKMMVYRTMCKSIPNKDNFKDFRTNIRDYIGYDDIKRKKYLIAINDTRSPKMINRVMVKTIDKKEKDEEDDQV